VVAPRAGCAPPLNHHPQGRWRMCVGTPTLLPALCPPMPRLTATKQLRLVTVGLSGGESAHAAVSRRPPVSLDTVVARTHMYTYGADVWDSSIVHGPIFRRPFPNSDGPEVEHCAHFLILYCPFPNLRVTIRHFPPRCTEARRGRRGLAPTAPPQRPPPLLPPPPEPPAPCPRGASTAAARAAPPPPPRHLESRPTRGGVRAAAWPREAHRHPV
jgi:hypothetical protein